MSGEFLFLLVPALLAGCAASPHTGGLGSGDYVRAQARTAQQVERGVIESTRAVTIDAGATGASSAVAPVVGAVAGGALGSTVGKGKGKTVATVLGALGGAAVGSAVQQAGNTVKGIEITIKLPNRSLVVTQADEGIRFRPGDRAKVINDGRTYRVAPD